MQSNPENLSPFLPSNYFPDVNESDEQGLLCVGGLLEPDWLVDAYSHGIFPWPFLDPFRRKKHLLGWFSPDPRCIFDFERFHIPRRLKSVIHGKRFRITSDVDFEGVMRGCAGGPGREAPWQTWITPDMIDAYVEMNRLGLAHSVEAWSDDRLVGGVYGIALRGLFAAESMFFREPDASKVALVALIEHLKNRGFRLVDIQMLTPHTERFGAVEISRDDYLRRLDAAMRCSTIFGKINQPFS